ncbi:MAG: F0F1 ATP synthase subunit epsilon [Alphaproteobacteria bacterium]|nr:F0F1 ATP synthase subunit epsilon [Rhodobiaceae bacterium]MBO6542898.1 F0F1 ATP synthase subunit epsilon [Alphaproteobacteria bacterium]MBO6627175.1 F0F1 ATP synthase subunit epsilon [Alphaproteobacteria bacterium]MDF1626334.1 F0F1 ATP synthase subunit epsilon [Parvibaculaceae bacterium]
MAEKLKFDLVAPERLLLSTEADMVVVPGTEGDFGVMPGHSPVMATLRSGVIDVTGTAEGDTRIFVRGGFAEVTAAGLTVLAEEATPLAELDAAALDQRIKNASEDVQDAKSDDVRVKAQGHLDQLKELRDAL